MAEAAGYDPVTTQEKTRLGFAESQSRSESATQLAGLLQDQAARQRLPIGLSGDRPEGCGNCGSYP